MHTLRTQKGQPHPLGPTPFQNGVNFALESSPAKQVFLEFFHDSTDSTPSHQFTLDPNFHKSGNIWHIFVESIKAGQLYGYRIDGEFNPSQGQRCNIHKFLLDPYAKAISPTVNWDFFTARSDHPQSPESASQHNNTGDMPKCVVVDNTFDWKNDKPLNIPWEKTIIYETHVKGLTHDKTAQSMYPGTYKGLIEKIPYFQELGITALELLPIFEFNENQGGVINPQTGKVVSNYWGYSSVSFFAPKASYSIHTTLFEHVNEFKTMVYALHQAGIEVILDIVLNHTAEGNESGPTLSYRGIDNNAYYHLENDKRYYKNFAGTGNTLNTNTPIVTNLILEALRYWVSEMHVDGFRFDLAPLLNLNEEGFLLTNSSLLKAIANDPVLKKTKLIAEAWAPGNIYQVGNFGTPRWAEWNNHFRDDIRKFWKGDEGWMRYFANRFCGSEDMYTISGKTPASSINFIACHDGFTLNDLVSYEHKHNEANYENNSDGSNQNESCNYGIEGNTNNPAIKAMRIKQIKNFLLTLFLSRGVPMLLGGDEFRRTQNGNNNAYCQDNEISWYNWNNLKEHKEIFEFTKHIIQIRKEYPVFAKMEFYKPHELEWFNPEGNAPNWDNAIEKMCVCLIHLNATEKIVLMVNAYTEGKEFVLPQKIKPIQSTLLIDTSKQEKNISLQNLHSYYVNDRTSALFTIRV